MGSMMVWVGSAMERSSSGSSSAKEDDSSEDSWVDLTSKDRIVDFPSEEEVVLPVWRRWSWSSSFGSAVGGGEDMPSRKTAWRRGEERCDFVVDL